MVVQSEFNRYRRRRDNRDNTAGFTACRTKLARVCLLAELLLAKFVQRVELLGQDDVLLEAAASQLHADDDRPVWHHHRHCPEVDLEVLRQLLSTRVAGILYKHRHVVDVHMDLPSEPLQT